VRFGGHQARPLPIVFGPKKGHKTGVSAEGMMETEHRAQIAAVNESLDVL
jgi:hypothetical protein